MTIMNESYMYYMYEWVIHVCHTVRVLANTISVIWLCSGACMFDSSAWHSLICVIWLTLMSIHLHTYTYIYVCVCVYICTYIYVCVHMCAYTYVHTCIYQTILTCICVHIYAYTHISDLFHTYVYWYSPYISYVSMYKIHLCIIHKFYMYHT